MTFKSLVTYTRTTLMATPRPSYVPRDTSAKPPDSSSTESSEQSGICMDVGITRCRLHSLQSLLSNFVLSRSDSAPFSRRCGSCQSWGGGCGRVYLVHFIDLPLNFRLRVLYELEERGNLWEDFPTLPPLAPKCMVHNREFTSLVRLIMPASCDYTPNRVPQPSILAGVYWTGWSFTGRNIGDHVPCTTSMIRYYPCEDLVVM